MCLLIIAITVFTVCGCGSVSPAAPASEPSETTESITATTQETTEATTEVATEATKPTETEAPTEVPTEAPKPTETKPAHEHDYTYGKKVVAPTCAAKGYTVYSCACGASYKDIYTDATGHDYVQTAHQNAAVNVEGYTTYTCTKCGNSYTETIEALPRERPTIEDARYVQQVINDYIVSEGYILYPQAGCYEGCSWIVYKDEIPKVIESLKESVDLRNTALFNYATKMYCDFYPEDNGTWAMLIKFR